MKNVAVIEDGVVTNIIVTNDEDVSKYGVRAPFGLHIGSTYDGEKFTNIIPVFEVPKQLEEKPLSKKQRDALAEEMAYAESMLVQAPVTVEVSAES